MKNTDPKNNTSQTVFNAADTRNCIWVSRIFLALLICCTLLLIHVLQGSSPFAPSPYNSYRLQAMQWRKGKIALDEDVPHLELAVYNGKYYVSFPPVPAVPIYFLSFVFGSNVPDTLLIQLYAIFACLLLHKMLMKKTSPIKAALWAFLFCFASSLLPLLQNGGVWYQAQVLAFLFTVWSIERMDGDSPAASLFLYALSVGCRPFNALYGPLIMLIYIIKQKNIKISIKKLLPGICLGLLVAGAYALYNYMRFGDIFEFGHSYLPEFSTQGGTQFSVRHLAQNIQRFVFGLPLKTTNGHIALKIFGFSLFLANPLILCMLIWLMYDIKAQKINAAKILIVLFCSVHIFLFLLHRTGGGYQYGARYFADCLPYCFLYALKAPQTIKRTKTISIILLALGFAGAAIGACYVHL
jgi:hypothetical protein